MPRVEFLRRAVEENTGVMLVNACRYSGEAREGSDAAQVYITRQLQRHPTMRVKPIS